MIRGSRVDLLAQGREQPPRDALARLGISVDAGDAGALPEQSDSIESSRLLLLHCIRRLGGGRSRT